MKITDLLDPRSISLDAAPTSKSETLDKAVELMAASGKLSDVEAFRKQVYAREEESTTGIGEGIAIPHGKCDAVKKPGLAAMVIKNGVDFDSLDGEPVTLKGTELTGLTYTCPIRHDLKGKIIYGGTEYEFTIDAASGNITEWDAEALNR